MPADTHLPHGDPSLADPDGPPPATDVVARRHLREQVERSVADGERNQWRHGLFPARPVTESHEPTQWAQRHWTSRLLHRLGEVAAHSGAGVLAAVVLGGWLVLGAVVGWKPWWQTVLYSATSCVTLVMVFVIQHTQARQMSATQRKLDELIRSSSDADSELISVEDAPDAELTARAALNVSDRVASHGPDAPN